ncbi:RNA polymerase sigma factor SigJ [Roseiterribacter gracilis]|uniref:Sigma factor n=1 Tax=Roseiterribacter gracilis TaxID=2812848 RepID=A0A8S8XED3_9PROT|nr:sigma factor [Rhodospirillales bacterium TMPK1]
MDDSDPARFEELRPRLQRLAYRLLGSVAEAEDVVQDAFLRWAAADRDQIQVDAAWLSTVTTRLALDRLRSASVARTDYVGPWLPEPMLEAPDSDAPDYAINRAEDVSTALLLVLERLAPTERAAFLLHESFDMSHADIANALGLSEAGSRQMVHRARERVRSEKQRFEVDPKTQRDLVARYAKALIARDTLGVAALLAPDVVLLNDGGGHAGAARNPIEGAAHVTRLFDGINRKNKSVTFQIMQVNGEPGVVHFIGETVFAVDTLRIEDGRIAAVYRQMNPYKLTRTASMPRTPDSSAA